MIFPGYGLNLECRRYGAKANAKKTANGINSTLMAPEPRRLRDGEDWWSILGQAAADHPNACRGAREL
jgi:hypothetical protein